MTDQSGRDIDKAAATPGKAPATVSRRALIKGGVTAMPAILTLHSGAALARSSNMISAAPSGTTDSLGRTLCVDKRSVVYADDYSEIYDLGEPPYAEVNIIPGSADRQYYVEDNSNPRNRIMPGAMCERGGEFWWKPDGHRWEPTEVPQGFVVSAGAMTSIAGYVKDNLL